MHGRVFVEPTGVLLAGEVEAASVMFSPGRIDPGLKADTLDRVGNETCVLVWCPLKAIEGGVTRNVVRLPVYRYAMLRIDDRRLTGVYRAGERDVECIEPGVRIFHEDL